VNFLKRPTLFLAACWFVGFQVYAEETVSFQSGEKRTMVVELFTSQGCSSCPPAEAWLNRFLNDPRLWTDIVPVAFHVDYWDNLGWKDPDATRTNTERQYQYRSDGHAASVYTPCFIVDGREWKGWFDRTPLPKPSTTNAGILSVRLDGRKLDASFTGGWAKLDLNVAILGAGSETDVTRGENRGRQLHSDFVVLQLIKEKSDSGTWSLNLPSSVGEAGKHGLSVWVSRSGDLTPLQAAGGWVPAGTFD
jgi:hypothetical protein